MSTMPGLDIAVRELAEQHHRSGSVQTTRADVMAAVGLPGDAIPSFGAAGDQPVTADRETRS